jgi:hypothetical protein
VAFKKFEIPKAEPPPTLPTEEDGHEALVRVEPELAGLASDQLLEVNLDVPRACSRALGALPAVRSIRPHVVEQLVHYPLEPFDKLEDYTMALYYAHHLAAPPPKTGPMARKLYGEVLKLREHLLFQAEALMRTGHLDSAKIDAIREGGGYEDAGNDAIALSLLFRTNWGAIESKTGVRKDECSRADQLGRQLVELMGRRKNPLAEKLPRKRAFEQRSRCFTLFYGAYDKCRRAVTFLRWDEGDADDLVPNLYAYKKIRRKAGGGGSPSNGSPPDGPG